MMKDDNEDDLKNKEDLHIGGRHTALDIFRFAVFLCFGNEASRDRFVGLSVGLDTNFKKVWRLSKRPS